MAGDLGHGWDTDAALRMAWRAARTHPTSLLSLPERADIAYFAIAVLLLESDAEPDRHAVWNRAVGAISGEAERVLREHGYSTRTNLPSRYFAAYWLGLRPPRDALEDSIIEPIAVRQMLAALPAYERRAIEALAEHGSYAAAADALGWSYNSIRHLLSDARAHCRVLWNYPDPPGRHWGQDKPGQPRKARAMHAIRERKRRRDRAA